MAVTRVLTRSRGHNDTRRRQSTVILLGTIDVAYATGQRIFPVTNELSERDDVDIDALPLAQDRGVGWQALRDAGAVCPAGESFILTSADAVDEAAKAPTVF